MAINVAHLCPWDLTLAIAGEDYLTKRPTWGEVLELSKLEKALQDPQALADLETRLRAALRSFLPEAVHPQLERCEYDELLAAFAAASTYFGEWLRKKQAAAVEAARGAAAATKAPPASGR